MAWLRVRYRNRFRLVWPIPVSPLAVGLLGSIRWHQTLLVFAALVLLVLSLAFVHRLV
jgi:hypothetical protein